MNCNYTIDKINEIEFETTEISEFAEFEGSVSLRLTQSEIMNMPDETKDISALRTRLATLFHQKLEGSYVKVEVNCDIKPNTFQKVLRKDNGRNVTYKFLAKFCIGACVGVDEAKKLFALMGYLLNEKSRYDYILLCELDKGADIADYDETLRKYGYPGIFSEE